MTRLPRAEPFILPDPEPVPYSPEYIAACYGVAVTDPCPVVTLPRPPSAADVDRVIAASLRRFDQ